VSDNLSETPFKIIYLFIYFFLFAHLPVRKEKSRSDDSGQPWRRRGVKSFEGEKKTNLKCSIKVVKIVARYLDTSAIVLK